MEAARAPAENTSILADTETDERRAGCTKAHALATSAIIPVCRKRHKWPISGQKLCHMGILKKCFQLSRRRTPIQTTEQQYLCATSPVAIKRYYSTLLAIVDYITRKYVVNELHI